MHRKGFSINGTLHLTTHHLIFSSSSISREFWVSYPTIGSVFKNKGSALVSKHKHPTELLNDPLYCDKDIWSFWNIKIIGKDFTVFSLDFEDESKAQDVFDSILKLTVLSQINQLYAFIYSPNKAERSLDSWHLYDPVKEFQRQGLQFNENSKWRISDINKDYSFCSTYPRKLIVPKTVSDTLLSHSVKYRSQNRIPTLTYYYSKTGSSITRSAQPLPGITQQRSIQDEKLVNEIFKCSQNGSCSVGSHPIKNIIVDARPATNAMAQTALGGGTENTDNYNFNNTCTRMFLGIDNIHVMRDTLNSVVENFLVDNDLNLPIDKANLNKGKASNWLKYVKLLLSSTDTLVKFVIFNKSNLLIHCSDGWDRTAQVCSLVQICLDPYFRTLEGFMVLIEKDWLSFGHRFAERSGHLSSESVFRDNSVRLSISGTTNSSMSGSMDLNSSFIGSFSLDRRESVGEPPEVDTRTPTSSELVHKVSSRFKKKNSLKLTSPVFQQFLDCVYQLLIQNPTQFEYNERFLRRLLYHLYSCQYGSFLFDNEQERVVNDAYNKTHSVWDYFRSRKNEFTNSSYQPIDAEEDWILPNLNKVQWWSQLFGKRDEEMNRATEGVNGDSIVKEKDHSNKKSALRFPTFSLDIFGKK